MPNKSRRRWFRFRLRTLLILIAVVAAPLAWIAKERRQSQRELQAAEELSKSDFVEVETGGPYDSMKRRYAGLPQGWWRDLARLALGERVLSVRIGKHRFADATMLAKLKSLRRLNLQFTQVTDLRPIAALEQLEWLDLGNTPVIDVSPLAKLHNLTSLSLDSTHVSDLTPLVDLSRLEWLNLRGTQVRNLSPLTRVQSLATVLVRWAPASQEEIETFQKARPDCRVADRSYPTP